MRRGRILLIFDFSLVTVLFFAAFLLRLDFGFIKVYQDIFIQSVVFVGLIYVVSLSLLGVYRSIVRYFGVTEFMVLFNGVVLSSLLVMLLSLYFCPRLPRSIILIHSILSFSFLTLSRVVYRSLVARRSQKFKDKVPVLIIGAGSAGVQFAQEASMSSSPYEVLGFLDDDVIKHHRTIHGKKVYGPIREAAEYANKLNVKTLVVAIPSLKAERLIQLIDTIRFEGCVIKTIPGLSELSDGKKINELREISIEDVLGREEIHVNDDLVSTHIKDQLIWVTGGAGSIGSELVRQILRFSPKKVHVFDLDENGLYHLDQEFKSHSLYARLEMHVSDVTNRKDLIRYFNKEVPTLIYHAAAHKHVPLMEDHPIEALRNNIFSIYHLSSLAIEYQVKKLIYISSDKAVNPTNIMGATKRYGEKVIQYFNQRKKTEFVAVRFGNVLGSNGSVLPLFKKQIESGGPITLTHKDITRYFMTIPEASRLVLQAASFAKGGEIFILDMGQPIRIYDLARNMIHLSGRSDVSIEIVGLRKGEKLYEELNYQHERLDTTLHPRVLKLIQTKEQMVDIEAQVLELITIIENEDSTVDYLNWLSVAVPSYEPRTE